MTKSMGRARPGRIMDLANKSVSATHERIHKPPEPTILSNEDKRLHDEQQNARVEMLMLKGVRKPHLIKEMLNLSTVREVEKHMVRVKARWELIGSGKDIKQHRGEALMRLDLVESEVWAAAGNLDEKVSPGHKRAYLELAVNIQSQRNELLGLTPKVIERLALMPDNTNEIVNRLAAQTGIAGMAGRMAQILAERREKMGLPPSKTIDGSAITGGRSREAEDAHIVDDAEA